MVSGATIYMEEVFFVDDKLVWIFGSDHISRLGSIMHSTDGGGKFSVKLDSTRNYYAGFAIGQQKAWALGTYGSIFYTPDAGVTWQEQRPEGNKYLFSLYFADEIRAFKSVICHYPPPILLSKR